MSSPRVPACCINPDNKQAFLTTDTLSGTGYVRYGWIIELSDEPKIVSQGEIGYRFIRLFWSKLLGIYVGECVYELGHAFGGILPTVKNSKYSIVYAVAILQTTSTDYTSHVADIYENDSNIYVNLYALFTLFTL